MEQIIKEFEQNQGVLEDFRNKMESLIMQLLKTNQINFHHINSRIKSKDSLSNKLLRKQGYRSLRDITDTVGCRIISYFEDDVDKIAGIIEKEFAVDKENSVDKRRVEYDRFGYQSLHYVVSLNKRRTRLTENKHFKDLKFEIQIRSILQHSWAEIEHDIGYKGKHAIPEIGKRRFARISALLETADLEFVALRNELKVYEKEVKKQIKENPSGVRLDQASLLSFIQSDRNLQAADEAVANNLNLILNIDRSKQVIEKILIALQFAGIKTIEELQNLYSGNLKCIIDFSKHWRIRTSFNKKGMGIKGISLYELVYIQAVKTKTKEEIVKFHKIQYKDMKTDWNTDADRIINAYKKLEKSCQ